MDQSIVCTRSLTVGFLVIKFFITHLAIHLTGSFKIFTLCDKLTIVVSGGRTNAKEKKGAFSKTMVPKICPHRERRWCFAPVTILEEPASLEGLISNATF